jgi:hypothetical protein
LRSPIVLTFGEFTNQLESFAWFGVATCLEFGVNQCIVYCDLVSASLGRDESNAFDLRLKVIKQFVCQAYSPVSKMSDCTVGNGYF